MTEPLEATLEELADRADIAWAETSFRQAATDVLKSFDLEGKERDLVSNLCRNCFSAGYIVGCNEERKRHTALLQEKLKQTEAASKKKLGRLLLAAAACISMLLLGD